MHRLAEEDLGKVIGSTIEGYRTEMARIQTGPPIDSDNYSFLLGGNIAGEYVTRGSFI